VDGEEAAATPPPLAISQLDIRIGRIVEISKHPDADSLYVEKVEMGEEEPRTIISGLVEYQPIEQMEGRSVVVLASLKPRNMRGIKSHGMLLCASNKEHTQVEPLRPPEGSQPGERVFFGEGSDNQPPPETPNKIQKKKIWEELQPDLKTGDDKVATWQGHPMMTSAGAITADSIAGGGIS